MEATRMRTITGSVGAKEALIQDEFEIKHHTELDDFYTKIAGVKMHADWGRKRVKWSSLVRPTGMSFGSSSKDGC